MGDCEHRDTYEFSIQHSEMMPTASVQGERTSTFRSQVEKHDRALEETDHRKILGLHDTLASKDAKCS